MSETAIYSIISASNLFMTWPQKIEIAIGLLQIILYFIWNTTCFICKSVFKINLFWILFYKSIQFIIYFNSILFNIILQYFFLIQTKIFNCFSFCCNLKTKLSNTVDFYENIKSK